MQIPINTAVSPQSIMRSMCHKIGKGLVLQQWVLLACNACLINAKRSDGPPSVFMSRHSGRAAC